MGYTLYEMYKALVVLPCPEPIRGLRLGKYSQPCNRIRIGAIGYVVEVPLILLVKYP